MKEDVSESELLSKPEIRKSLADVIEYLQAVLKERKKVLEDAA